MNLAKTEVVFGGDIRCSIRHYKSIKRGQDSFLSAFVLPFARGIQASRDSPVGTPQAESGRKERTIYVKIREKR